PPPADRPRSAGSRARRPGLGALGRLARSRAGAPGRRGGGPVRIYDALEDSLHVPWAIQASILAALILVAAGLRVRRQIAAAAGGILPDEGVTLRNALEVVVETLSGLARDTMGEDWRRFFPLVGTIFVFILVSNLLGLVPGVGGASSDVNMTTAWAVISFVAYHAIRTRRHA